MTDALLTHRHGGVLTVTFNRPASLNAFRRSDYQALHELLGDIERDPAVRVVVLTGSGRGFCAGEDLRELDASSGSAVPPDTRTTALLLQDITRRIVLSDRVYVAAVNGVAAGFGAELACACDLRLGSESAQFLFPEVRRGLFITNGISYLLPRIVGDTWARTLLLSGQPVDAATALRIGLVTHLLDGAGLAAAADTLAAAVASNAPTAVRLTKQILRPDADALERALAAEVESLDVTMRTGEYREGAQAFVERRPPQYGRELA